MESLYLPQIWLALIAFFLLYYVVTDGSDLGIGIISLFSEREAERGVMMESIGSVWHGHQTWLVLLGGMLFGAFPVFYAVLLSSLYIPMICMLIGLALRGVSFEFRARAESKGIWSRAFGIGSLITAGSQGLALGGLLGGLPIRNGVFSGEIWAWLTPFSVLVAVGVIVGYTMLGANYLIMKTEGDLQDRAYRFSGAAAGITLVLAAAAHTWVTFKYPFTLEKWALPGYSTALALLLAAAFFGFVFYFRSLVRRKELTPFLFNIAVIVFSFSALSLSFYPNMIPNLSPESISVSEAAASSGTLAFMLVAMAVLLPIILTYTAFVYRTFRGKVSSEAAE
ncbi:MAG: cytochrome d ubiquinol oxidase subunit II [Desulfohalobiaceae bacterium]|nr:cytochrome d ubiquinol oxidase subunit II [Desulfohalobiaceae bacterium]